ncbi:Lrp/AsnC family transcriptional regulator [Pseudonocardia sp. MH-G8]|uniref:Lrp/AsnC family transcriptional regulator n=1 Tax=Pseudonocardia sp. MH-G8 TaxID=1854588 RepID=UPI00117AB139|nr:Lrp/AsnC family transcriptional regulator [Pseudonocardia sp. MH-G8]
MRPKPVIPAAATALTGAEAAVPLSDLDRRIVAALQINGRATWQQVANVVGASESAVSRRANRMIKQGVLRVFAAADPLLCGLGYPVLLQIECAVGAAGAVARTLAARPDVRFVALLGGGYDLVVELIVPSRAHLTAVLVEELNTVPGIVRTTTENVVRTFKTSYDWGRTLLGDAAALLDRPPETASPPELDDIDLRLIQLLTADGRSSVTDLAERLAVSESMARRRLEQLTASGCLRFGTLIDSELLGYHWELFVWLGVDLGCLDRIARELATHPEVRYVSATAGYSDLACEVVLRDHEDLYRFNTEVLGSLEGVNRVEIGTELHTVKRAYVNVSTRYGVPEARLL